MLITSWWMVGVQGEHFSFVCLYHYLLKNIRLSQFPPLTRPPLLPSIQLRRQTFGLYNMMLSAQILGTKNIFGCP